jgi:hypothetical protein
MSPFVTFPHQLILRLLPVRGRLFTAAADLHVDGHPE